MKLSPVRCVLNPVAIDRVTPVAKFLNARSGAKNVPSPSQLDRAFGAASECFECALSLRCCAVVCGKQQVRSVEGRFVLGYRAHHLSIPLATAAQDRDAAIASMMSFATAAGSWCRRDAG